MAAADDGEMLTWGGLNGRYTFKLTTAAFQKLSRTDTWRWVTQDRINNNPAEQYVGPGSGTITLEGVIYASYNPGAGVAQPLTTAVGTHKLDMLRLLANQGVSKTLTDGRGNVLGEWVLIGVREEQSVFLVNGAPQKQGFSIEFRSYGEDNPDAQVTVTPDPAADAAAAANSVDAALSKTLQDNGVSKEDADRDAGYMDTIRSQYGNAVAASIDPMATVVAATWGLKGIAFQAAVDKLAASLAATNFADAQSILNNGLASVDALLTKRGVQDGDAANNALALLGTLPASGDRGIALTNVAKAIDSLPPQLNDALPPADRLQDTLAKTAVLRAADPNYVKDYYPTANGVDYSDFDKEVVGSQSFADQRATLTSQGVHGTTAAPTTAPAPAEGG